MKRTKKRQNTRQRRLFHEQLEDRRLLTADPGWLFGIDGFPNVRDFSTDSSGDVYVTATLFSGTVDLDPGPGVTEVTSSESNQVGFLAKYASDGSFSWVTSLVLLPLCRCTFRLSVENTCPVIRAAAVALPRHPVRDLLPPTAVGWSEKEWTFVQQANG